MREKEIRRAAEQVRWHEGEAEGKEMIGDALHDALQNLSSGFDETADEVSRREIIEQVLALPDTLKEVLLLYGYKGYARTEGAEPYIVWNDGMYLYYLSGNVSFDLLNEMAVTIS